MVGRECSEWFGGRLGGRVIVTVVFGGSFGIVNPTRWVGSILRLWIVLPLVPGFPLVCEGLVKGLVVVLVRIIVGRWILMVALMFPRCRMKGGWSVAEFITS